MWWRLDSVSDLDLDRCSRVVLLPLGNSALLRRRLSCMCRPRLSWSTRWHTCARPRFALLDLFDGAFRLAPTAPAQLCMHIQPTCMLTDSIDHTHLIHDPTQAGRRRPHSNPSPPSPNRFFGRARGGAVSSQSEPPPSQPGSQPQQRRCVWVRAWAPFESTGGRPGRPWKKMCP